MKKRNRILIYPFVLAGVFLMLLTSCAREDKLPIRIPVQDIDGNLYHTVVIGTQTWMVENLKTTHYRNGDPIGDVDNRDWTNLKTGAYCDYGYDPTNNLTYGRLYNWYAATDSRNIAPIGWRVPSQADVQQLINTLGGNPLAAGKLKESGTSHWLSPNTGADNASGFTALPAGFRRYTDPNIDPTTFSGLGQIALFWTTTASAYPDYSSEMQLLIGSNSVGQGESDDRDGFSIRCIKN